MSRAITIAIYLACALALLGTDLAARYTKAKVPTASRLLRWMLRRRSAQIGMLMAWWWIGWHFLGQW